MEAISCVLCKRPAIVRCTSCQQYCCGRHIWLIVRLKQAETPQRALRFYCARCMGQFDSKASE